MPEKKSKISYFGKNNIICPVCEAEFKKEEILSGGGRMNAGDLTDELHRLYIPTQKYGEIYPLIYSVTVCPECLYAAYATDFTRIAKDIGERLFSSKQKRIDEAKNLFPEYNFSDKRTLREGILSYILGVMSYDIMGAEYQSLFRQGLSCLRAAWLCDDYDKKEPEENFNYLRDIFYRKARFFYSEVLVAQNEEREDYENIPHYGPDLDHNHGFNGVIFISGLLEYKYGPRENTKVRRESLAIAKITVARVVGMGKSSKSKTSDFVESARELHADIQEELKKLEEED